MKRGLFVMCLGAALTAVIAASACGSMMTGMDGGTGGSGGSGGAGGAQGGMTLNVDADITADTTWTTGNTYVLKKHIYVGNATQDLAGAVVKLTIQEGVLVKGEAGSSIVVTRTGRIDAVGTAAKPIVFTSAKPEGDRDRGDWGGIVMLGRGRANFSATTDGGVGAGENFIEGFPAAGTKTIYGSTSPDEAWNCGTLKYARIEFAGYRLSPNNELNSLTLGACGSGTTLDYVQLHEGLDDAIEFFGGNANLKHAVVSWPEDDGLDWDNGWSGKVQFLAVVFEPAHGNNGIEADNDATGSSNMPRSVGTVWNATFIGRNLLPVATEEGGINRGMLLRRNTMARVANSIFMNFGSTAVNVESGGTGSSFVDNSSYIKNSIFFHNPTNAWDNDTISLPDGGMTNADVTADGGTRDGMFDETQYLMGASNRDVNPGLTAPVGRAAPVFKPTGMETTMGAATPPADPFFDSTANFIGAVGPTDWTAGWTAYPQN